MRFFIVRILIVLCLVIFLFPTVGQSVEKIYTSADHAVLMEESTGRIVYEKNPHERRSVASITKVMTAIVALENGDLKDRVIVSKQAAYVTGSSIYLEEGESISLEDLLYGLMLRSGNDASIAIAEHIGGSVEGFVYLMNEKALYLGMTNTNFANPHGLDEENHYSSAYDIAILMQYAMQDKIFQIISSTKSYQSKNLTYKWINKNKLLTQFYEHSTGGKTGYTKKAGRTLVSTAEKDNLSLIAVTLNASNDWNDHMLLFETGFEQYELVKLERKGERNFQTGETFLTGYLKDDIVYPMRKEEQAELRKQVYLYKNSKENKIATIIYLLHNKPIIEIPVYHTEMNEYNFFMEIKRMIKLFIRLEHNG